MFHYINSEIGSYLQCLISLFNQYPKYIPQIIQKIDSVDDFAYKELAQGILLYVYDWRVINITYHTFLGFSYSHSVIDTEVVNIFKDVVKNILKEKIKDNQILDRVYIVALDSVDPTIDSFSLSKNNYGQMINIIFTEDYEFRYSKEWLRELFQHSSRVNYLETISNREEDRQYTLGYKRFSLLGAMLTAVILMIGSVLVILENVTKIAHPQPVNEEGILWLGIIAVAINVLASLVVRKGKTKNESILSLHFLEDTLGWLAVILMAIILRFTDWYILDPLLSLVISIFILSKAIPRFWSALKIFLDAVPEGVETSDLEKDLEALPNVKSVNQLSIWSMDGLENNAIVHICIKDWEQMMETKEVVRQFLEERGVQNITIEVDSSQSNHAQHRRRVRELEQKHGHH